MKRIDILQIITRLIIGGAQEHVMLTADIMNHDPAYADRYHVQVVSGPQTGSEGSLIEEVRRRGIPLQILPSLHREMNLALDVRAFFALRRIIQRGNYRIVHTNSSKAGVLGRLAARSVGTPLVVHTVHGWSFHDHMPSIRRRFYIALEKLGAATCDAMTVVSPKDIEKGLAHGIGRPELFSVIRSGIELDRFGHPQLLLKEVRQKLGLPADATVIGSVTRLSAQKAPLDLVETLAILQQGDPSIWAVITGDGPLREEVQRRIHQLGITDRTILTGLRRDIPELMAAFDIFVLSSLWEGLPRVLPQAMASGLPIVCTNADGSAEAVVNGVTGYLVPRGDPRAMAKAVAKLVADRQLRHHFGQAAKARATLFGMLQMVKDVDQLYRRLAPPGWYDDSNS